LLISQRLQVLCGKVFLLLAAGEDLSEPEEWVPDVQDRVSGIAHHAIVEDQVGARTTPVVPLNGPVGVGELANDNDKVHEGDRGIHEEVVHPENGDQHLEEGPLAIFIRAVLFPRLALIDDELDDGPQPEEVVHDGEREREATHRLHVSHVSGDLRDEQEAGQALSQRDKGVPEKNDVHAAPKLVEHDIDQQIDSVEEECDDSPGDAGEDEAEEPGEVDRALGPGFFAPLVIIVRVTKIILDSIEVVFNVLLGAHQVVFNAPDQLVEVLSALALVLEDLLAVVLGLTLDSQLVKNVILLIDDLLLLLFFVLPDVFHMLLARRCFLFSLLLCK